MNKLSALFAPAFLAVATLSSAQQPQSPPALAPATLSTWDLSWLSVDGRSYFFLVGDSLSLWNYGLGTALGDGENLEWGFESNSPRFFVRLKYTDFPTTNPDLEDFDGDGIPSLVELVATGTDPLAFNANVDSDGDGLNDAWEIHYWGNITAQNGAGDPDLDGLTNKEEFDLASNPKVSESANTSERMDFDYDLTGRLTNASAPNDGEPKVPTIFAPDEEGNLLSAQ